MKKILIITTLFPYFGFAQLDNSPFYEKDSIIAEKNDLFFNLKSLGFNRNDEYYTKFANGQTFFGYQFNPEMEFYLSDHVSVSAGLFATKDFGNANFTQVQPTYQVKLLKNTNTLLFGNIRGNLKHKYIEPIYDFRRIMYQPLESGLQYLVNKQRWNADFWLDWQRNIYEGSDFLEQIYGGMSGEFRVVEGGQLEFTVPVQFLVYHEGGQIDVVDDRLKLTSNGSIGMRLDWKIKSGVLDEITTENHFVFYDDYLNDGDLRFQQGNGIYLNAAFKKKHHSVMLSYWHGNHFQGLRGAPVFNSQSMSFRGAGFIQEKRNLLFLRIISNYKLSEDVGFSLRLEPYYDFSRTLKETFTNGILDFSHSLYIQIDKRFFVKNLKPDKPPIE